MNGEEFEEVMYEIQKNRQTVYALASVLAIVVAIGAWYGSELRVDIEKAITYSQAVREHLEFQGDLLESINERVNKNAPLLEKLLKF